MGNWQIPIGYDINGTDIWSLWVRNDNDGTLLGYLDDYDQFQLVKAVNNVGNWQFVTRPDSQAMQALLAANQNADAGLGLWGPGIILKRGPQTVMSGPVRRIETVYDTTGPLITVSGNDDIFWMSAKQVIPNLVESWGSPNQVPLMETFNNYLTSNDLCSSPVGNQDYMGQVLYEMMQNALAHSGGGLYGGMPPLYAINDPGNIGPKIFWKAAWTNFLTEMQTVTRVQDPTTGVRPPVLVFDAIDFTASIWEPATTAYFSMENGSISGYDELAAAAQANDMYVEGGSIFRSFQLSLDKTTKTVADSSFTSDDVGRQIQSAHLPIPCAVASVTSGVAQLSHYPTDTITELVFIVDAKSRTLFTETINSDDVNMWGRTEAAMSSSGGALAMELNGQAQLYSQKSTPSVVFDAVDSPYQQWGKDYKVGDKARVQLPDLTYREDYIAQITLTLQSGQQPSVQVVIGAIPAYTSRILRSR